MRFQSKCVLTDWNASEPAAKRLKEEFRGMGGPAKAMPPENVLLNVVNLSFSRVQSS